MTAITASGLSACPRSFHQGLRDGALPTAEVYSAPPAMFLFCDVDLVALDERRRENIPAIQKNGGLSL